MSISTRYPTTRPTFFGNFNRKKILNSDVKYSRGSIGTYIDKNGIIQTADIGEPRWNYDPVTGEFKGLLIEESRTNVLKYSNTWGGGVPEIPGGVNNTGTIADGKYQKIGVTLNYGVAPDGSLTSMKLADIGQYAINGISVDISIYAVTEPSATINTFSTFVRKIGSTDSFTITSHTSMNTSVTFTFSTESFSIGYGPWHIAGSEGYQKYPNGWYRIWWSYDRTKISPTNATLWAKIQSSDPNFQLELWGAQKEAGLGPTSYIPTSGSAVTTAADTFTANIDSFKSGRILFTPESSSTSYSSNIRIKDKSSTPEYALEFGTVRSTPTISTVYSGLRQGTASLSEIPLTTLDNLSIAFNYNTNGEIDFSTTSSDNDNSHIIKLPAELSRKLPTGYTLNTLEILNGTNVKEIFLWDEELNVNQLSSLSTEFSSIGSAVEETSGFGEEAEYFDYGVRPSLDLNFADRKDLVDNTTGRKLVDFSRGGVGTYVDANGVIQTDKRINLLSYSEDFNNSSWAKDSLEPVQTDSILSPQGTQTADKIIWANGATSSGYVRKGSTDRGTATNPIIAYTLTGAGTPQIIVTPPSGSDYDIINVGNGWYRCWLYDSTADQTLSVYAKAGEFDTIELQFYTNQRYIRVTDSVATQGDGTSGVYIWGAQLEEGNNLTEYIPTTNTISGSPRFDHDPETGESLGLLMEEGRTNYLKNSENLSLIFTGGSCILTDNQLMAPNGTFTATKVSETFTNVVQNKAITFGEYLTPNGSAGTANIPLSLSGFVKAGTLNRCAISMGNGGALLSINIDLTNGSYTEYTWSGVSEKQIKVTPFPDGWYQFKISAKIDYPFNLIHIYPRIDNVSPSNTGIPAYQGNGNYFYAWGFQWEIGSFPTSYIPTPTKFDNRSTIATYYDANGIIQTAGVDVARDNAYLPDENGAFYPSGLLVESQKTNYYTRNRLLNSNLYTLLNVNIDIGVGELAPDGETSFLTFTTTSATNQLRCYTNSTALIAPDDYWTCSVYVDVKNSSTGRMTFALGSAGSNHNFGYLDINANGTIAVSTLQNIFGGAWDRTVPITSGYEYLGRGIYRVYYVVQNQTSDTANWYLFGYYPSGNKPLGWTISLWGAQIEKGLGMTSFIPSPTTFQNRPSPATYYDENGVIKTAAIDEARNNAYLPDKNGIMRPVELLIEPLSSNKIKYSGSVSTGCTVQNINVTLNAAVAPDGTTTATKLKLPSLIDPGTSALASRIYQGFDASAGDYAVSIFFKPVVSKSRYPNPPDQPTVDKDMYLNLFADSTGGVVVNLNTLEPANEISKVEKIGNSGWYRLSGVINLASPDSDFNQFIYFSNRPGAGNTNDPYPVGSEECLVWGWQVEPGNIVTSYIATTNNEVSRSADTVSGPAGVRNTDNLSTYATASRPADVASITGTNFSSWYNQSAGSIYVDFDKATTERQNPFAISDGVGTNKISVYYDNTSVVSYIASSAGGYDQTVYTTSSPLSSKYILGYSSGNTTPVINGNLGSSITEPNLPINTTLFLGRREEGDTSYMLTGHISRLTYYPVQLPNTTLQTITLPPAVDTWELVFDSSLVDDGICGIKIRGTCTYTIDWGDGSDPDTVVNTGGAYDFNTLTHQYFFPTEYTAKIQVVSGQFTPYHNNNVYDKGLVKIKKTPVGISFGTEFQRGFTGSTNLKYIDPDFDVSSVTNFGSGSSGDGCWRNCTSLTSFPNLDFSSAINMEGAWYGCSSLKIFPEISIPNVLNLGGSNQGTWEFCTSLTKFPLIDTSNVENMERAWKGCSGLTEFPAIDTSNCTNIQDAWNQCTNLKYFPFIDTSNVTNGLGNATSGRGTWRNLNKIKSFPAIDTSKVTGSIAGAWAQCSSLESFPLLDFSGITDFGSPNQGAWENCTSLTSFPAINTSAGTNFYKAWYNCSSLTSFPAIDTSNATDLTGAWSGCRSLQEFPFINTSKVTNLVSSSAAVRGAWSECRSLTSFPALDLSKVTTFGGANGGVWYYCDSLRSFPTINFALSTSFNRTWDLCNSLSSFGANCFDNSPATDYSFAFRNCRLSGDAIGNILSSIDTAGQSSGILDINGSGNGVLNGPNYDWNNAAWVAYNNLIAKNWTINYNDNLFSSSTLDLRFAETKTLDSRITFSRGSIATYFDSNGVIQTVSNDIPRFDHDPVTGESLGLLVEEGRSNTTPYSNTPITEFPSSTIYTQKYAGLAPDNKFTATKIIVTQTQINTGLRLTSWAGATDNTRSIYVKTLTGGTVFFGQGGSGDPYQWDTSTLSYSSDARHPTGSVQDVGNGWYRLTIGPTVSPGGPGNYFTPRDPGEYLIYGAQREVGTFPTSYIPTPATFIGRNSIATYYDANGVIQTAAIDVARDNAYLPDENGNFISAGLLLEGSETNYISSSANPLRCERYQVFTNASNLTTGPITIVGGGTFTAYVTDVQPIDGSNCYIFVGSITGSPANPATFTQGGNTYNGNGNRFGVGFNVYNTVGDNSNFPVLSTVLAPDGVSYAYEKTGSINMNQLTPWNTNPSVFSVFVKAKTATSISIRNEYDAGIDSAVFDFTTGTWSSIISDTEAVFVQKLPNGWFRIGVLDTRTRGFYNRITSSGSYYCWGFQYSSSSYMSSYIPTNGSQVTRVADSSSSVEKQRSADVASITGTNFSNFYNNTEGTWFTDMAFGFTQDAGNPLIFGGVYYTTVAGGSVRTLANSTIMGGLSNSQTIPTKTAVALKSLDFKVYRDGTQTSSNNSLAYTPTGTQWLINSSLGSLGRIKRIIYWPKRLPDECLKYITS